MKKSIVSLFVFLAGFGVCTTSCEDILTPDMERYTEGFNGTDTVNFYLGIMRNVQDLVEQNVILNEIRADLADTTMYSSDSIARIARFDASLKDGESALLNRAAYYKVINQCNFYLAKADSNAIKNDILYMRKEIAQVHMVRAWTYLQLVQHYGRVPFITVPVDNAHTGWETNPAEGWATPDNLIDLLEPTLLLAAQFEKVYGFPNYGQFNTGKSGTNILHQLMLFPSDLVLGDLYLLRGNGVADYEKAAMYYYTWLDENAPSAVKSSNAVSVSAYEQNDIKYLNWANSKNWYEKLLSYANVADETVTLVPSAANSSFGKVLTTIANLYGFQTSSYNQTSGSTTTGEITISPNAKMRQIGPSQRYIALNKAQTYVRYDDKSADVTTPEYYTVGDGRLNATAPMYQTTEDGKPRFIQKFGTFGNINQDGYASGKLTFNYAVNVYRKRQVYLRFAEAINRAGFPAHAFAIIRDGLNKDRFPSLQDSVTYVMPSAELIKEDSVCATGDTLFRFRKAIVTPKVVNGADNHYIAISADELLRAQNKEFLNFKSDRWANTAGVHALGCGQSNDFDTIYTYKNMVEQRIAAEWKRSGYLQPLASKKTNEATPSVEYADTVYIAVESDSTAVLQPQPVDEWEVEAVELLIGDEMALETAFEGFRYFDLMRQARHKQNAGYVDGIEWFAWMISNRSVYQAPYMDILDEKGELVAPVGTQNTQIYELLKNQNNWYLPNPIY